MITENTHFDISFFVVTQHKIRPLTDEEKETMFLERGECMEPKCSDCNAKISDTKPFLRFEAMDFCGKACLQHFFMANAKKCFSCEANTTAVSSHVFSARIGSELRYFCTSACQTSYLAMLEVCTFCDSAIKDADFVHDDAMKKYCSTDCMDKYAVFIVKNKKLAKERCIDCNELKTVKVNFDYNGTIYPFCSLKCFFAVRLVCGIQAGKISLAFSIIILTDFQLVSSRLQKLASFVKNMLLFAPEMCRLYVSIVCHTSFAQRFA